MYDGNEDYRSALLTTGDLWSLAFIAAAAIGAGLVLVVTLVGRAG